MAEHGQLERALHTIAETGAEKKCVHKKLMRLLSLSRPFSCLPFSLPAFSQQMNFLRLVKISQGCSTEKQG